MKNKILSAIIILVILVVAVGCNQSARDKESQTIETNQKTLIAAYPVPRFDTSLERDILVQLYSLRNKARNTYTVITSDGTGTPMFDCPSIGYPIANDVRLTARTDGGTGSQEQAEPNGVYPADSSWGTWVLCVNPDGSLNPIYNEMDTLTFPFPIHVDYATGKITKTGDSTVVINLTNPEK